VPTTNEISLLSYSEVDSESFERCERHPDGQFVCYLSAPILKEVSTEFSGNCLVDIFCFRRANSVAFSFPIN
jgi:hypothetical protein